MIRPGARSRSSARRAASARVQHGVGLRPARRKKALKLPRSSGDSGAERELQGGGVAERKRGASLPVEERVHRVASTGQHRRNFRQSRTPSDQCHYRGQGCAFAFKRVTHGARPWMSSHTPGRMEHRGGGGGSSGGGGRSRGGARRQSAEASEQQKVCKLRPALPTLPRLTARALLLA